MKTFLSMLAAGLLFPATVSFAQTSASWVTVNDLPKVKIDTKTGQCFQGTDDLADYTQIRITNKTAAQVKVSFRIDSYFDGNCNTCGNGEYAFTVTVPAGSSVESSCDGQGVLGRMPVFIRNVIKKNYSNFDRFEITGITVN